MALRNAHLHKLEQLVPTPATNCTRIAPRMATFSKRGKRHRAQIRRAGVCESKTFPTKTHAMQWAIRREAEIDAGHTGRGATFRMMMERYRDEVSPTKRGHAWEVKRINAMLREDFADLAIERVTTDVLGKWRDRRLKTVKGESFIRDLTVMNSAWEVARKEWKICTLNPCKDLRRPERSRHRETLISEAEQQTLLAALGWSGHIWLKKHEVALAFLLALETAMRAGEIIGIKPENIHPDYVHLPRTKNGRSRDVPLSPKAVALLKLIPEGFTLTPGQLDSLFRKYRPAGAKYTFHDTRHTAITRLAGVLPVMDLARMVGHSDLKMLMRYYNATASDIAKRLS